MPYDKAKVNWTEQEHNTAENADKVYEILYPALKNGIQVDDIQAAVASFKPSLEVWQGLIGGTQNKAEFGRRLIALGVMLERDNELLG